MIRQEINLWYNTNLSIVASNIDPNTGYCNEYSTTSGIYGYGTSINSYQLKVN